jgi:uncharacterized protein (TIGR04255 family)
VTKYAEGAIFEEMLRKLRPQTSRSDLRWSGRITAFETARRVVLLTPMDQTPSDSEMDFARPPITEAVIERRFSVALAADVLDRLRQKFESGFPAVSQLMEFAVGVEGTHAQMSQSMSGYRLVNKEGTAIVVLTAQAIAYSSLAPYPGWAGFSAGAADMFRTVHDVLGYIPLARLGVRYVNRLDIPTSTDSDRMQLENYILVHPEYPEAILPELRAFTMQSVYFFEDLECLVTLNVASVPPPVPHHTSLLFDIDIGRNINVPQKEDDINILLNSIRREKNRIFNFCLTDRMKGMFN